MSQSIHSHLFPAGDQRQVGKLRVAELAELPNPSCLHQVHLPSPRTGADAVIATYNRCPFANVLENPLAWLLQSFLEQRGANLERIFVVDDGSTDYTPSIVRRFQSCAPLRIEYIPLDRRKGSSAARNVGLHACRNDQVFICDDDCQLTPYALYGLQRTYDLQSDRDRRCCAVHSAFYQRAVRPARAVPRQRIGFVDERTGVYSTQLQFFPEEYLVGAPELIDPKVGLYAPLPIRHLCGVFLADRRAMLACGGFPEEFSWPNGFCEELELSYRLRELGRTIYHQPDPKLFALHYKYGWHDPLFSIRVTDDDERLAFGSSGMVAKRLEAANRPRFNSGNRIDLADWAYSKLLSYYVCFGRRSSRGARCWMMRMFRQFVTQNSPGFYGSMAAGSARLGQSERYRLWKNAWSDGVRFLSHATGGGEIHEVA